MHELHTYELLSFIVNYKTPVGIHKVLTTDVRTFI